MPLRHLPADTTPDEVAAALRSDGGVIVDRLVPRKRLQDVADEMAPHLQAVPTGTDDFTGRATRRVGGLIARSPASHGLVMHPLVTGAVDRVLADATSVRLHLTQIIAIGPGQPSQAIHRDQWAFDFFTFPMGYEVQCNTIWAMTDFTEENGATRVVPGSHRYEDKLELKPEQTEPAEMEAGSVLFYTGSLYHGGGENRSSDVRCGLNLTYARSWLRQEENQYLTVPQQQARELPEPLLRLMGYRVGAYALGYVDDLRDPLDALRGTTGRDAAFAATAATAATTATTDATATATATAATDGTAATDNEPTD